MTNIFIRSLGSVSALGGSMDEIRDNYLHRTVSRGTLSVEDELLPVYRVSPIGEERLSQWQNKKECRHLDRVSLLALVAAEEALSRDPSPLTRGARTAVIAASARGATETLERAVSHFLAEGGKTLSPFTSPTTTAGNIATSVAQLLIPQALPISLSMTCASFGEALLVAQALLIAKRVDTVVVVGAEAPLTPFTVAQFRALGLYTQSSSTPCEPHRGNRNSLCLGEGGVAMILSTSEGDASPLGRITGLSGAVENASSLTAMSKDGAGVARAVSEALHEAKRELPDLIVLHAPGTVVGDRAELEGIRRALPRYNGSMIFNKHLMGHTFGASLGFSLELALLVLNGFRGTLVPYAVEFPTEIPAEANHICCITAGFGGPATAVLLER